MTGPLGSIIERLRRRWPGLHVLLRANSAYAREELLAWCEDNGVDYAIGLARYDRLVKRNDRELAGAKSAMAAMRSVSPTSNTGSARAG